MTMDYVNYVCVKLYTIVIPACGVGSMAMGGIAVTPIRLSLWDGLCGQMFEATYNPCESYARTYAIRSA